MNSLGREDFIKIGDLVFQFSPRAVLNLSRKLTLCWISPYHVVNIFSPSLCVIFPVGDWALNKKEISTLTSRLRRVDSAHSQILRETVDLDQIREDNSEGEDVILQPTLESNYNALRENSESEVEVSSEDESEGDMPMEPPTPNLILMSLQPLSQDPL